MKDKSLTRVSVFLTSQIISLFGSVIVSYSIVWYITLKTSSTMALAISIVLLRLCKDIENSRIFEY